MKHQYDCWGGGCDLGLGVSGVQSLGFKGLGV